ncbi:MAG: LD-carboxypeptidase [Myxococcales bacterium]
MAVAFPRPPALQPGARVHLVAPSSPFDRTRFDQGLPFLTDRYQVSQGDALFAREGFLAGDDRARLTDLRHGLDTAQVHALIAARGGYGATRLLPSLEASQVRTANKWLVGFSDVTALHALWARAGLCSIHGPMVCSLGEGSMAVRDAFFDLLEGQDPRPLAGLSTVSPGRASGRLFGGNLTVLAALVGTPFAPPMDDTILVLEDITERPYRVDRMLTNMLQAGFLRGVRGVILGQFTQCDPGPDGTSVEHVLAERLSELRVPIVANAPVGHVPENMPLLLGSLAQLDADAGNVMFELV